MARRLAFGWAVIATLWCGPAFALGLGDIKIHSALNEKLDAEIELLETRGMREPEILAQLASADDFKRVGVERFFFLTGLRFRVEMPAEGPAILRVSSDAPITEPYLNFLVQVMWPSGRLLKEYTVLLDPPTYKNQAAPAVASPSRGDPGGGPAGRVERTPTRPDSQVSLDSAPPSTQPDTPTTPPEDRLTGDSYGVTDRDDTLWSIAQRSKPAGVTVQQDMLAIVRLNPKAFIGGNINLLKAGYSLQLPSEADATAMSSAEAVAAVAADNEAWQAYRRGEPLSVDAEPSTALAETTEEPTLAGQLDATATPPITKPAPGPDGELRIVATDTADAGTGTGGGTDVAALESQLVASKEEADRISRERDEVATRLDQATGEAEQAKRLIEVRDQQIAKLQEQMKGLQGQPQTPVTAVEDSPKDQPSALRSLLASPIVLIGAGIVLVLIVVAGLVWARRRKATATDQLVQYDAPARSRSHEVQPTAAMSTGLEFTEPDDEPAEAELTLHDDDRGPAHEGAQTSDVIGEADIYIAYGRYPQAVSLLLGALEDDPSRSDVRLKLLEVYAETKAEAAFDTQMQELLTRCSDNEILLEARELETKLREEEIAIAAVPAEDAAAEATLDDFQLDLDSNDGEAVPSEPVRKRVDEKQRGSDDLGGDLGIDFKVDDDAPVSRAPVETRGKSDRGDLAVAVAVEEDEFDLEDLEFEAPAKADAKVTPRKAGSADDADDAFDFLNEEDAATTKLDLARAYIDMGDEDGAREILGEVLQEGSSEQQQTANELLAKMA